MGIVVVNTTVSLDGFVAGPNHEMDWIFDYELQPSEPNDAIDELIRTTGSILAGRRTYEVGRASERPETSEAFGGRWSGPEFVLTHVRVTAEEGQRVRSLTGDIRQAVSTALEAAQGKNLLVLGANVVQQCLAEDLVDEILILIVPVLLGDGISLFGARSDHQVKFDTVSVTQSGQVANLHFRRRR